MAVICHQLSAISLSLHNFTILPQSRRYSTPSGSCHWVHVFLLKYDLYEVNCCFYSQQPSAISFNSQLYTETLCKAGLAWRKGPALVRLRQRAAIIAVKNRSLSERSEFGTV